MTVPRMRNQRRSGIVGRLDYWAEDGKHWDCDESLLARVVISLVRLKLRSTLWRQRESCLEATRATSYNSGWTAPPASTKKMGSE